MTYSNIENMAREKINLISLVVETNSGNLDFKTELFRWIFTSGLDVYVEVDKMLKRVSNIEEIANEYIGKTKETLIHEYKSLLQIVKSTCAELIDSIRHDHEDNFFSEPLFIINKVNEYTLNAKKIEIEIKAKSCDEYFEKFVFHTNECIDSLKYPYYSESTNFPDLVYAKKNDYWGMRTNSKDIPQIDVC